MPPNNDMVGDGRVNPFLIKYLYTAEDPYTALVEARPYLKSMVSIAEIKTNEPLLVADFSFESFGHFEKGFERDLLFLIMDDFSTPSNGEIKNYLPIQYITEFVKSRNYIPRT